MKSVEEFRLAIASLLNLDTIINELKKLRENLLIFVKENEKKTTENRENWRRCSGDLR
ncbi:MAG: hypothetical protein LM582_06655 [Desulfurococcaceae archaeon]|nr:hypothetical protein [Desulfurococcaceae archaeon]